MNKYDYINQILNDLNAFTVTGIEAMGRVLAIATNVTRLRDCLQQEDAQRQQADAPDAAPEV